MIEEMAEALFEEMRDPAGQPPWRLQNEAFKEKLRRGILASLQIIREPEEGVVISVAKAIADTATMAGPAVGEVLQTGDTERLVRRSISGFIDAIGEQGR